MAPSRSTLNSSTKRPNPARTNFNADSPLKQKMNSKRAGRRSDTNSPIVPFSEAIAQHEEKPGKEDEAPNENEPVDDAMMPDEMQIKLSQQALAIIDENKQAQISELALMKISEDRQASIFQQVVLELAEHKAPHEVGPYNTMPIMHLPSRSQSSVTTIIPPQANTISPPADTTTPFTSETSTGTFFEHQNTTPRYLPTKPKPYRIYVLPTSEFPPPRGDPDEWNEDCQRWVDRGLEILKSQRKKSNRTEMQARKDVYNYWEFEWQGLSQAWQPIFRQHFVQ